MLGRGWKELAPHKPFDTLSEWYEGLTSPDKNPSCSAGGVPSSSILPLDGPPYSCVFFFASPDEFEPSFESILSRSCWWPPKARVGPSRVTGLFGSFSLPEALLSQLMIKMLGASSELMPVSSAVCVHQREQLNTWEA
jgi:hypothetical protein